MMKDYANCSGFKILNENDEFIKNLNDQTIEKDYKSMIMNTPPSNKNLASKYLMISAHHGLFSCTPKQDVF